MSQRVLSLITDAMWVPHLAEVFFPTSDGPGLLLLASFVVTEVLI